MAYDRATVQYDRAAVREVLDKARAENRTALTAPEGRRVCEAYGITTPGRGWRPPRTRPSPSRRSSASPWC
nr:hypothetical protein GCM10020093_106940 [Planobispora longispora]